MARMPDLKPEAMSAEQRRIHDEILAGPRGHVVGPLKVWLNSPGLADKAQRLGQFARFDSSLSKRQSELAILVTGRFWSAEFEWYAHKRIALEAGISEQVVDAIRDRRTPVFERADEQAVYDFACALHRDHAVSDAVYQAALGHLGQTGVIDLVGVLGYYTLISMTLNVFDVPLPPGETPELTGTTQRR